MSEYHPWSRQLLDVLGKIEIVGSYEDIEEELIRELGKILYKRLPRVDGIIEEVTIDRRQFLVLIATQKGFIGKDGAILQHDELIDLPDLIRNLEVIFRKLTRKDRNIRELKKIIQKLKEEAERDD